MLKELAIATSDRQVGKLKSQTESMLSWQLDGCEVHWDTFIILLTRIAAEFVDNEVKFTGTAIAFKLIRLLTTLYSGQ